MVRKTGVQFQVESYQKLLKWYQILRIIRLGSTVKWSNPGNWVTPSPTPRCRSNWKGHPPLWSPCTITLVKSKVGDHSLGRPEGSLFHSYLTDVLGRALLLSLDCSTLPSMRTLYCWVLSKEVSSTIFKVFGMTRPRIEPKVSRIIGEPSTHLPNMAGNLDDVICK